MYFRARERSRPPNQIHRTRYSESLSLESCMKLHIPNNPVLDAALKLARVPKWANMGAIKDIYDNCPEGYHVENNLQYLLAKDNLIKGNKFTDR